MSKTKNPKAPEKKFKIIQNPAITEIEAKMTAKATLFKQLKLKERVLNSQLEQIQHDILKTSASYNTLSDLKKTLLKK